MDLLNNLSETPSKSLFINPSKELPETPFDNLSLPSSKLQCVTRSKRKYYALNKHFVISSKVQCAYTSNNTSVNKSITLPVTKIKDEYVDPLNNLPGIQINNLFMDPSMALPETPFENSLLASSNLQSVPISKEPFVDLLNDQPVTPSVFSFFEHKIAAQKSQNDFKEELSNFQRKL